jgi:phosphoribosylamine-glycine ligase
VDGEPAVILPSSQDPSACSMRTGPNTGGHGGLFARAVVTDEVSVIMDSVILRWCAS